MGNISEMFFFLPFNVRSMEYQPFCQCWANKAHPVYIPYWRTFFYFFYSRTVDLRRSISIAIIATLDPPGKFLRMWKRQAMSYAVSVWMGYQPFRRTWDNNESRQPSSTIWLADFVTFLFIYLFISSHISSGDYCGDHSKYDLWFTRKPVYNLLRGAIVNRTKYC